MMSWVMYKMGIIVQDLTSKFSFTLPGKDMSNEFKLCYDDYCGREKEYYFVDSELCTVKAVK